MDFSTQANHLSGLLFCCNLIPVDALPEPRQEELEEQAGQTAPGMIRIVAELLSKGTFGAVLESTTKRRGGESIIPLTLGTIGRAVLPAPYDELIAAEETEVLMRAVETLSSRQKDILRLRYGLPPYAHEHSLREVAQLLGIARQRVHAIQARAEERLADMLAEDEQGCPY